MKKINYSIIGCGNIAGNYDLNKKLNGVYTHASAFNKNKFYNPIACIDTNHKKHKIFKKKWKFKFSSNNMNILNTLKNDLIIICTPTNTHNEVLRKILITKNKPKVVLCEKPLTYSYKSALNIIKLFKKKKIFLAVNFHRRYDKTIINIKKNIEKKIYGDFKAGYAIYNGGIYNTGSHLIDLLLFFFKKFRVTYVDKNLNNKKTDYPISFIAQIEKNYFNVMTIKESDTKIFEIKLIFQKKIISTYDGGLSWLVQSNKEKNILSYDFSFYKNIFLKKNSQNCFLNLANSLKSFYLNKKNKIYSADEALLVHKIINQLKTYEKRSK